MKKVKVLFVALIASLFLLNSAYANSLKVSPKNDLQNSITQLVEHPNQYIFEEDVMTANIVFMVNRAQEVVVVDPGTNNKLLGDFIKTRLNYKRVDCEDFKYLTIYAIKVTFKK